MKKILCFFGIHRMTINGMGGFGYFNVKKGWSQHFKCVRCGTIKLKKITRKVAETDHMSPT